MPLIFCLFFHYLFITNMLTGLFTQFLIEIIAAVILIPIVIKYSGIFLKYFKRKRFEQRMKKVYDVYSVLTDLQSYLSATRVLLMRTTNGGGLPAPGRVLYATMVAEVSKEGETEHGHTLREEWQNRLIDHEYIRMLERVYTDGNIKNTVSEMPKHSMLRGAYEKIDVKQTKVIKIGIYSDAFYYLSIACNTLHAPTEAEEYTINTAIQKLQQLLK